MSWLSSLSSLWRNVVHRERVERDLDNELRSAFELLVEEKLRAGMRPKEARRAASIELGGVESIKEQVRAVRAGAFIDSLLRDVRHSVRVLVRGRLFTAIAVLTLALGIGANSAIFTLVNGLLLRALPYPDVVVDRLVWIATTVATSENLDEWRAGLRSLERFAAFDLRSAVLTGRGPAERLWGTVVTEELLPLLGAQPVMGRLWTDDEQQPGGPSTVIVSQRLWNRLDDGHADVGTTRLTLGGVSHTIIGVLPASFDNLGYDDSDLWFPAGGQSGRTFSANIIGLRRPGASIATVQAEASALAERVEAPSVRPGRRFANVQTLNQVYRGDTLTSPLIVLLAATGFVLLIACANVANLLLSRAAGRGQEMAVRAALGAHRITLLRQLLTESAVLALAGAVAGLVIATVGLRMVLAIMPSYYGWDRAGIHMDHKVIAFTLLIAAVTTLLAGLVPAIQLAKQAARVGTGSARASAARAVRRSREMLITAEIALALVLLIGTGLMIRTFLVLRPASPGFEFEDRMVASITLPSVPERDDASIADFARRLLHEARVAAPAARIALATDVPMSGFVTASFVTEVDGRPFAAGDQRSGFLDFVPATPNYFDVVGMRVVRGRRLAASDVPGSAPVVVINESAARRFWPDVDPIGRSIVMEYGDDRFELTVAGVVADTRRVGIHTRSAVAAFVSFWQIPSGRFELVAHQPHDGGLNEDMVRRIVASIDPGVPVASVTTLEQIVARSVARPRYHMVLMAAFGVLGVVLALVGCYGVLSYSVAQRTREIGVRIALGASHRAILRNVLARASVFIALGLIAGSALALPLTRILESNLYGVTPTDPATFAGASLGLAAVSLFAAYLAARRAAGIQPTEALRAE
ncbi:MAG: ADOP family duplicated permease [Longimicrobiales bacterium]